MNTLLTAKVAISCVSASLSDVVSREVTEQIATSVAGVTSAKHVESIFLSKKPGKDIQLLLISDHFIQFVVNQSSEIVECKVLSNSRLTAVDIIHEVIESYISLILREIHLTHQPGRIRDPILPESFDL